MKTSQWIFAAVALAVVVFVANFAMNYLGSNRGGSRPEDLPREALEVTFLNPFKKIPADGSVLELEQKTESHQDFWFYNGNEEAVKLGLEKKGCRCSSVLAYLLPTEANARLATLAGTLFGLRSAGLLESVLPASVVMEQSRKGALPTELLAGPDAKKAEAVSVAPGQTGWIRLRWKGEQTKFQRLGARVWMDNQESGKTTELDVRIFFHPSLRVATPVVAFGVLRDEDLAKGVSNEILCFSSTRSEFRLQADPKSSSTDPFIVGDPIRVAPGEFRKLLRKRVPQVDPEDLPDPQILCAYRVPITLRAVSSDGKTPFQLGPFVRGVTLRSPDIDIDPISVVTFGRVRGLIDVGGDEDRGGIQFGGFPRDNGSQPRTIALSSTVAGLTLKVNEAKTAKFLSYTLKVDKDAGGVRNWSLEAKVKANKARGKFPRSEDPDYADSAIYLEASGATAQKGTRLIRIPVFGTANE